jgi:hypothetical protein
LRGLRVGRLISALVVVAALVTLGLFETQIANTLAPYTEQLAGSQAGTCLEDLESAGVNSGG